MQAQKQLMAMPRPVGVLCCSDVLARDLVDRLHASGLEVPAEVAVIGVDNAAEYCESVVVSVSSVPLNGREVGRRAVAVMLDLLRGVPVTFPVLVPPGAVVERESTNTIATRLPGVAEAIRFIRTRACDGIDVSDVVRVSGLSRATVDRHMRQVLGHSAHDEIRRLQMARARYLLTESNLDIRLLSARCGFDDPRYFMSVFRKHHGQTPTQYRRSRF